MMKCLLGVFGFLFHLILQNIYSKLRKIKKIRNGVNNSLIGLKNDIKKRKAPKHESNKIINVPANIYWGYL